MISQLDKFLDSIIEHSALFPEIPDFSRRICTMRPEHRKKCSHLKPACIKLTISLIFHTLIIFSLPEPLGLRIRVASASTVLPLICNCEKGSDIQGPIGITAQSHIQTFYDLDLQILPVRAGISRPQHSCILLTRCITGTCQIQYTHILPSLSLVLINSLCMLQGKSVGHSRIQVFLVLASNQLETLPGLSFHRTAPVRTGKRLCRVTPPGIKALVKQPLLRLFPVHFSCFFIKSIIGCIIIQKISGIKKFLMIFSSGIHIRPYRDHAVGMHLMNPLHALLVIPITGLIQNLLPPVARIPGIPVLNHTIQRNPDFSVTAYNFL